MKELDRLSAEEAALRRENRALERNNGLLKHDLKEVILNEQLKFKLISSTLCSVCTKFESNQSE